MDVAETHCIPPLAHCFREHSHGQSGHRAIAPDALLRVPPVGVLDVSRGRQAAG